MLKYILLLITVMIFTCSCINNKKSDAPQNSPKLANTAKTDTLKIALEQNESFFADSLLKTGRAVMKTYMAKYQTDSCGIIVYKDSILKAGFEGVKEIKGIRENEVTDSVFVMPPFNHCDDGQSYCFYNKTLPRLYTGSYCCHPDNLFVVGDIDEDGVKEIGIYYSSCASRYKVLKIFSLKNGLWEQIGDSDFDIFTQDPSKVKFDQLVKKISKGKFTICNFLDGKTSWQTISMK
ncbi:hypothetical protein DIU31_019480 [Mucilaginibacter rubeus]|uniref:Uncharacterized protein n=1 Tax=Mucilaginibacter rubeus TaxID=2027860 RepID=A0AAE6JH43_9SPHI|nr:MULTISPECIES: hypothetical protein [Mucilaginibacter]QEM05589.1 hypothetical protein DIU31_019480 [Mucilaginibacter rubeus]QEM18176.1 hypothetical protein DIU38_019680 [Mucilaginibacter gossypii]QTE45290.1 hypothetical protein J3L19_08025 [Mucilaginibacter rubeus]QTE51886.1 hypothetical protein J3L21_08000 [Mucilaginibacter rubeus]QTE56974.1 hypothetical protein J3L23_33235 [Mucilaginibacter rubeus]